MGLHRNWHGSDSIARWALLISCLAAEGLPRAAITAHSHRPMLCDSPPCRYPIFFNDTDEDESWGHPALLMMCLSKQPAA
eukprot:scaffold8289_cov19-Tisochrysis_lutea.AAC.4